MTSRLKIKQFSIVAEPTFGFSVFTKNFEQTIILLFLILCQKQPPELFPYYSIQLFSYIYYFGINSCYQLSGCCSILLRTPQRRLFQQRCCSVFWIVCFVEFLSSRPKSRVYFFYLNLFCLCHFFLIKFLNLVAFSHSVLVSQFDINRCLQDSHAVWDGVICNISQWLKLLTSVKQGSGLDIQEIWIRLYDSTVYYISFGLQCMYQNYFIMTIILLTLLLHLL